MNLRPFERFTDQELRDMSAAFDCAVREGAFYEPEIVKALATEALERGILLELAWGHGEMPPERWSHEVLGD